MKNKTLTYLLLCLCGLVGNAQDVEVKLPRIPLYHDIIQDTINHYTTPRYIKDIKSITTSITVDLGDDYTDKTKFKHIYDDSGNIKGYYDYNKKDEIFNYTQFLYPDSNLWKDTIPNKHQRLKRYYTKPDTKDKDYRALTTDGLVKAYTITQPQLSSQIELYTEKHRDLAVDSIYYKYEGEDKLIQTLRHFYQTELVDYVADEDATEFSTKIYMPDAPTETTLTQAYYNNNNALEKVIQRFRYYNDYENYNGEDTKTEVTLSYNTENLPIKIIKKEYSKVLEGGAVLPKFNAQTFDSHTTTETLVSYSNGKIKAIKTVLTDLQGYKYHTDLVVSYTNNQVVELTKTTYAKDDPTNQQINRTQCHYTNKWYLKKVVTTNNYDQTKEVITYTYEQ